MIRLKTLPELACLPLEVVAIVSEYFGLTVDVRRISRWHSQSEIAGATYDSAGDRLVFCDRRKGLLRAIKRGESKSVIVAGVLLKRLRRCRLTNTDLGVLQCVCVDRASEASAGVAIFIGHSVIRDPVNELSCISRICEAKDTYEHVAGTADRFYATINSMCCDSRGNLYVTDLSSNGVFRLQPANAKSRNGHWNVTKVAEPESTWSWNRPLSFETPRSICVPSNNDGVLFFLADESVYTLDIPSGKLREVWYLPNETGTRGHTSGLSGLFCDPSGRYLFAVQRKTGAIVQIDVANGLASELRRVGSTVSFLSVLGLEYVPSSKSIAGRPAEAHVFVSAQITDTEHCIYKATLSYL